MATTMREIADFMREMEINFEELPERQEIVTGFRTNEYIDPDGDHHLQVVIKLSEDGEFLHLFSPSTYTYLEGPHKLALFQVCMMAAWQVKMLYFGYDPSDGEVRASIDLPLEDARLTGRQFHRALFSLVQLIEEYDGVMRHAIATGEVKTRRQFAREHGSRTAGAPAGDLDLSMPPAWLPLLDEAELEALFGPDDPDPQAGPTRGRKQREGSDATPRSRRKPASKSSPEDPAARSSPEDSPGNPRRRGRKKSTDTNP